MKLRRFSRAPVGRSVSPPKAPAMLSIVKQHPHKTPHSGVAIRSSGECNCLKSLAPRVGFEPTTLRLTAERLVAASRCKHNYLDARNTDYRVYWGDSGGTNGFV